ncbi:MAG: DUF5131 family protein, partial [Gemmatimonadota bacterium]
MATKIPYCDEAWNPVVGCSPVSPGCDHCYAARVASRGLTERHRGLATGGRWTGEVRLVPEVLDVPLQWRKPRRVLVPSMGDLFHPSVSHEYRACVFGVMVSSAHTFLVLTKRAEAMLCRTEASASLHFCRPPVDLRPPHARTRLRGGVAHLEWMPVGSRALLPDAVPPPNILLGVTVENQAAAERRLPILHELAMAGWRTWISVEPLLGPVDLRLGIGSASWVAVGGETGPGARRCHTSWIRSVVDQCAEVFVPVFVKQIGTNSAYRGGVDTW